MLILAAILIVLGLLVHGLGVLVTIGIIVGVIGLILLLVGSTGHPVGGRRYWY